jgi:transcriptional regulator with XRE-family HTH domain
MRRRPVHFKELGAFLVTVREQRDWQQAEAAAMAQRRGLRALTRQVLLRLENGQTKSPDPAALQAVAELYELDYAELVVRMMAERYSVGRDLLRHGRTGQRTQRASHLKEDPTMSNTFRPVFESLKQVAEGLILANEGVKRLADAVLTASQAHEDLRDTVARLESLVIQQGRDLHAMKTQLDNLGGAR